MCPMTDTLQELSSLADERQHELERSGALSVTVDESPREEEGSEDEKGEKEDEK